MDALVSFIFLVDRCGLIHACFFLTRTADRHKNDSTGRPQIRRGQNYGMLIVQSSLMTNIPGDSTRDTYKYICLEQIDGLCRRVS
jgi:hypothetical protein